LGREIVDEGEEEDRVGEVDRLVVHGEEKKSGTSEIESEEARKGRTCWFRWRGAFREHDLVVRFFLATQLLSSDDFWRRWALRHHQLIIIVIRRLFFCRRKE